MESAFISAVKSILWILIVLVSVYCFVTFNDPVRGGKGIWFLLADLLLAWYVLNSIQKRVNKNRK